MSSPAARLDLADLGFERGAHVLVKRALAGLPVGGELVVSGRDPNLTVHLRGWARAQGHGFRPGDESGDAASVVLTRGGAEVGRWRGSELAGAADPGAPSAVAEHPSPRWGLAARGARVEQGAPEFRFALGSKDEVWADDVQQLYRQAAAAQWDPATAIRWDAPLAHSEEIESALVQVLTFLIENETAALLVPARFAAQLHPHFKEVLQLLAIQQADEARHIEVFTRRALLRRTELGLSTAGGQASLKTLVDEPDFELASFLLSVLGEGSFVNLLWFLHEHAPDECTRTIMKLAAQDEARHVAFGLAHLARHARRDARLLDRLAAAVERRHQSLRDTAGLNEEVFDALVVLAAGSFERDAIARGHEAVVELVRSMGAGRRQRLQRIGFDSDRASALSALHTRNFM